MGSRDLPFPIPLKRPLVFLDLETTGVDITKDRIIQFGAVKIIPFAYEGGPTVPVSICLEINPCMPIPPEVQTLTGITDAMVAGAATFIEKAGHIQQFLAGCDLGGFNHMNFDVPVLWEEFHRAGITWDLDGVKFIDASVIFRKHHPRTLEAAVQMYCGRYHDDAHNALADALATRDVFLGQMARHADLPGDLDALAALCAYDNRVDLAGKIVRNDAGEAVFAFGNSRGVRVVDDPGVATWILGKGFPQQTKMVVRDILNGKRK